MRDRAHLLGEERAGAERLGVVGRGVDEVVVNVEATNHGTHRCAADVRVLHSGAKLAGKSNEAVRLWRPNSSGVGDRVGGSLLGRASDLRRLAPGPGARTASAGGLDAR